MAKGEFFDFLSKIENSAKQEIAQIKQKQKSKQQALLMEKMSSQVKSIVDYLKNPSENMKKQPQIEKEAPKSVAQQKTKVTTWV